jgi:hypothetical protein
MRISTLTLTLSQKGIRKRIIEPPFSLGKGEQGMRVISSGKLTLSYTTE